MTEELVSYDDLPIVSTGLHSNDDSAEPNTLTKPDIRLLKPTISMATDMFLKSKTDGFNRYVKSVLRGDHLDKSTFILGTRCFTVSIRCNRNVPDASRLMIQELGHLPVSCTFSSFGSFIKLVAECKHWILLSAITLDKGLKGQVYSLWIFNMQTGSIVELTNVLHQNHTFNLKYTNDVEDSFIYVVGFSQTAKNQQSILLQIDCLHTKIHRYKFFGGILNLVYNCISKSLLAVTTCSGFTDCYKGCCNRKGKLSKIPVENGLLKLDNICDALMLYRFSEFTMKINGKFLYLSKSNNKTILFVNSNTLEPLLEVSVCDRLTPDTILLEATSGKFAVIHKTCASVYDDVFTYSLL